MITTGSRRTRHTPNEPASQGRTWALLALAVSAFAIGATEFMTNGLLLTLSEEFHVSIATAGLLTTGYAAGIVVGGPILAVLTLRIRRKRALIGLLLIFLIGNAVCAVAPTFAVLLVGRFISAFTHGAFLGLASVVAASMVAPHRRAGAIALVFTGVTLSNVLGMPLGTSVGQNFGWRESFAVVIALGLLGLIGTAALVPDDKERPAATLRHELRPFRSGSLWLALLTTAIGFGGLFASFTYITPLLTHVTGFPETSLTWLLMIYGAGLVVGNWTAGRLADRHPVGVIVAFLLLLILALIAQGLLAANPAVTVAVLFVVGVAGFGLIPPLQSRVLAIAGHDASLVSVANIAAFNTGAALGSLLGATALEATGDYTTPSYAGALMSLIGLAIFVLSTARRRHAPSNPPVTTRHEVGP